MPYQFFPGCRPHSQSFWELPAGPTEEEEAEIVDALSVPPKRKGPPILTVILGGLGASESPEQACPPTPPRGSTLKALESPLEASQEGMKAPKKPRKKAPHPKPPKKPKTPKKKSRKPNP